MIRKLLWIILHPFYENRYTKKIITNIVNFFKPDFVIVGPHKIFIDKDDRVISTELLLSQKWEEYERSLFGKSIKPGDTVIDIGAHIGTYTLIAAQKVGPMGKVYAFEPLPKNFELLKKNVEVNGYKNVVLINKAVSNKNGTSKLFLSNEDNFGDQRIYASKDNRKFLTIKTITLDNFFKDKTKQIQIIKMDIQGSEVLALTGATKILKQNKHLKLFTELWPKALKESGSSATKYLNLLKKNGLNLYEIDSQNEKIRKVTFERILKTYPENSLFNADLFCVKE